MRPAPASIVWRRHGRRAGVGRTSGERPSMAPRSAKPGTPRRRSWLRRRWLALVVAAVVAFLYYHPLRSYVETRRQLEVRSAEVELLAARKRQLEHRLAAQTSDAALLREARRLGYVKPGERLYIVKGIPAWRRARTESRPRAEQP
jgi:cell division protein FtsB